jgi:hypothetical protein
MQHVPATGAASWNRCVIPSHYHHNKPILEQNVEERNPMYQSIFDFHIISHQNTTQNHTPLLSPTSHTLGTMNKFKPSGSNNYLSEVKLPLYVPMVKPQNAQYLKFILF